MDGGLKLKLQIIGQGVVGKATGNGFQRYGHEVVFKDRGDTLEDADIHFICVPESEVENVIQALKRALPGMVPKIPWATDEIVLVQRTNFVVIKSTVPPKTTVQLSDKYNIHICNNPEFLREGVAEYEFINPARIVIGECCRDHGDLLEELYKPFRSPIVRCTPTEAEMVKLASNCYLACLIAYWHEIQHVCEKIGINSHVIGRIAAMDPRISSYGASMHGRFGLRCLPKDLEQMLSVCKKLGYGAPLLNAVRKVNEE